MTARFDSPFPLAAPPGPVRLAACLLGVTLLLWAAPCRAQSNNLPGGERDFQFGTPAPDQLFRVESERAFRERTRREARRDRDRARGVFPPDPAPPRQPAPPRIWPHRACHAEPEYVCYGRLYFEQINLERYGWDLGPVSPLVSGAAFYKDLVLLPYHLGTDPCRKCECSAGYCLPGDPVPLLLYPPGLSLTGALAEAGTIAALIAIFP